MGKTKYHSIKRWKRRFHGNRYAIQMERDAGRIDQEEEATVLESPPSLPSVLEISIQSVSSSKIGSCIFDLGNSVCDRAKRDISVNRIVDVAILVSVLELLCCPECKENNLTL